MRYLTNVPLSTKFRRAMMISSFSVLVITCLTFVIYEYKTFRETTVSGVYSLGKIIASNCTASLAFNDQGDADEILATLSAEKHINFARLYDKNGYLFAQYPSDLPRPSERCTKKKRGHAFKDNHLESYHRVEMDHIYLGTLYLETNLNVMNQRFRLYGLVVVLIIIGVSLFASQLSKYLEKSITQPLLNLAKTAQAVSVRRNYTVRASPTEKFEVGELTSAFNHMLDQIEIRDRNLKDFNKNLEATVDERTAELNKAESDLLQLNSELEERVLERTNELQESQILLMTKNDALERANVDLDNFVYRASHDLQAPISNIEGLTLLLQSQLEGRLEPDEIKLLQMIELSLNKLKMSIIDLTEISKVQKDQETSEEIIRFEEIVKEISDDLWQTIADDGAEIITDFEVPEITYAYSNLSSILYNLISNAIKYRHPDRLPEIRISTHLENGQVVLAVQDNGLGISQSDQEKIFTMFKRLHSHVDGSGIGLYIARRIVENRRGRITVESEAGVGSTFKVIFAETTIQ